MILKNFITKLNTYLRADLFKDYCPNGLQVEGKERISRVATAVSATEMTLKAAVESAVDILIVHHGLFWSQDSYVITGAKKRKLQLLLDAGISLLAYHLPLDAHQEVGNNWKAARDLGWENLKSFGPPCGKSSPIQIGVSGTFSPRPIQELVEGIEGYYGHQATCALGGKEVVKSAALISGGAYKELATAAQEGVDCYITGNFDEPAWGIAHEENVHFLALGHSATERVGPKALAEHIQREFGLKSQFLDLSNPF